MPVKLYRLLQSLIFAATMLIADAAPMSDNDVQGILHRLDVELSRRSAYIEARQMRIDSLSERLQSNPHDMATVKSLGELYTSFNNDSALVIYAHGYEAARADGNDSLATAFRMKHASLMPLGGLMTEAISEYETIDTTAMSTQQKGAYLNCGRQMYSYLSAYYSNHPHLHDLYHSMSLQAQHELVQLLPDDSPMQRLNEGEYYYQTGQYAKSDALLKALISSLPEEDNCFARAAHIIADIANAQGNTNDYIFYLALSAIADTKCATREVTSLQELGQKMFEQKDVDRAHRYLYTALSNAVECHAETRILQTSAAVPLIESVHSLELAQSRTRIYIIITLMAITLVLLIAALIVLRHKIRQMHILQTNLQESNRIKEIYISQFLNLCSIYMDKLKQFCHIANRKISAGKVDDLYKLTKSGKFIENQSKDFYEVFDNAFIHIHPGFVEGVNALLRPDQQITLRNGELLNTDLRILAFLRLGIDDSSRIAQILNYSINTIYTYRNKLKNKAINRDTFESDILAI